MNNSQQVNQNEIDFIKTLRDIDDMINHVHSIDDLNNLKIGNRTNKV